MDGNIFGVLSGAISAMEVVSCKVELVINPLPNDAYLTNEEIGDDSVGTISGAALPSGISGTVKVIPVTAELDT